MKALRHQTEKGLIIIFLEFNLLLLLEIHDYEKNKEASKIKLTELETLLRETHNENLRLR